MGSRFGWLRYLPVLLSVGFLVGISRIYHSEFMQVQALRGNKTVEQYRSLIAEAAAENHDARMRYADVLYQEGETSDAIAMLQSSRVGRHNWQGWDRMGQFYETLAFSPDGTMEEVRKAAQYYDDALRVNPARAGVIRRRAVLALKEGDWARAAEMAQALDGTSAGNSDSSYIRAQLALAQGKTTQAMEFYQQIAAAPDRTSSTLFRVNMIENALRQNVGK